MKLQRTYTMVIDGDGGSYTVKYPLTLELDVNRNILASASKGRFSIYNLGANTRQNVHHDRLEIGKYRRVTLYAGYETSPNLPLIFQGNIVQALSYRRGVDWVTDIEANSGIYGMVNGNFEPATTKGPWDVTDAVRSLIAAMPNCTEGKISLDKVQSTRGLTMKGTAWELIQALNPNGNNFVDNERVYAMRKSDCLPAALGLTKITSNTGMLNSPRRHDNIIDVDIMFEPRLTVAQVVEVESQEYRYNNRIYQVCGLRHRGTISGAVDRGVVTTGSLWAGTDGLAVVP